MNYYHNKLQEIKKHGSISFMKIKYNKKNIILKLVDESDETINLLYAWRKKYRKMFATDFRMSKEKTRNWVKKIILENPTRILFIIYVDNQKIGSIGTAVYNDKTNTANLDTMMKDPHFTYPGIMMVVEKVYLKWMFDGLKLSKITGFLFSDNVKMMNLHKMCGFTIVDKIPLKHVITNDGSGWEKIESKSHNKIAERYFNLIELTRENLMKNFGKIEFEVLK